MKTINSMLPFTAMEELERQAVSCWEQMHVPGAVHKIAEVTATMPAFVVTCDPPILYVCFPTYKVDILLPHNRQSYDKDIEYLLADVSCRSRMRPEALDCAIIDRRYIQIDAPLHSSSTVCLGDDLQHNVAIRDALVDILNRENIPHIIFPVYQYKPLEIQILEDGESFVVVM